MATDIISASVSLEQTHIEDFGFESATTLSEPVITQPKALRAKGGEQPEDAQR